MDNSKDSKDSETKEKKEEVKRFTIKSATDLQRVRLEKLMKNPTKEIIIPDRPHSKDGSSNAPSFVRNVMGSSAGAGSGEFHVYRHLRRKEYARLKQIEEKSLTEKLDDQFQQKLDNNKRLAEEKTAKKRAKRQKKKKGQKKVKKTDPEEENKSSDESDEGDVDSRSQDEVQPETAVPAVDSG